jgi:hypothetical protein
MLCFLGVCKNPVWYISTDSGGSTTYDRSGNWSSSISVDDLGFVLVKKCDLEKYDVIILISCKILYSVM